MSVDRKQCMTNNLTILVVCVSGASSSILINKMKQHIQPGENWLIEAKGLIDIPNVIAKYDVVLLAPQAKASYDSIVEEASFYGDIKVLPIPADIFASGDGEKLDDMVRKAFDDLTDAEEKGEKMSETKKVGFMDKFQNFMEEYVVPVGQKIANQKHLAAVRDGLTILIPITVIGGFAMLIAMPPVPATITEPSNFFYAFLLAWKSFATANAATLLLPYYLTIGAISIYVVCGVSYQLATSYKMNGINNMIMALVVYLCVSGAFDISTASINVTMLGAGYMFAAMVIGLLVVEINRFFARKNIVIKLPDSVPPNVAAPFNVLLPGAANVILFIALDAVIKMLTGAGLASLVYTIFQPLMKAGTSLPACCIFNIISTIFWWFGIHGGNMVGVVLTPITTAGLAANAEAIAAGTTPEYILAGSVNGIFGNWITYLAMNIVILLFAKSKQARSVSKIAIVPSMFNINEPSIFGLPTVLNVYTLIPMLLGTVINSSIYWFAASMNLCGKFYITLPFTVPGPLAAWLGTGDIRTIVVWLVVFVIDVLLITPFIMTYDKQLLKAEQENENN